MYPPLVPSLPLNNKRPEKKASSVLVIHQSHLTFLQLISSTIPIDIAEMPSRQCISRLHTSHNTDLINAHHWTLNSVAAGPGSTVELLSISKFIAAALRPKALISVYNSTLEVSPFNLPISPSAVSPAVSETAASKTFPPP